MARKLWAKRGLAALATGTMAVSLAACGGSGAGGGGGDDEGETPIVGVAMPTQTSERWIADGEAVEEGLKEAGYDVDLQFANDDIPTQQTQVDNMITGGADVLIIAAIDGTALGSQLDAAEAAGIPVVSYDRLIRDSDTIDFYVSFDNFKVGQQQATSVLSGLGLVTEDGEEVADAPKGPFNVELFAGSLDDNNAHFFWDGAMDVLQPYFDDGTIVVPSKQTDIEQAATLRWQQETAQKRMEDLLTKTYNKGEVLDGVLSPYDGLSRGIITALQNAGYGEGDKPLPVVSGQDAEIASVKMIADGVQYATIFKDTRLLAEQAVIATQAYLNDEEPEANDTESYDNGEIVVPSYLLDSVIVYKDNVNEALVETGYWTADEVKSGQDEG